MQGSVGRLEPCAWEIEIELTAADRARLEAIRGGLAAFIWPTFPRCRSLTVEFAPFQCSGQARAHRKQRRARAEPSFGLCDRRLGRVWAGLR